MHFFKSKFNYACALKHEIANKFILSTKAIVECIILRPRYMISCMCCVQNKVDRV